MSGDKTEPSSTWWSGVFDEFVGKYYPDVPRADLLAKVRTKAPPREPCEALASRDPGTA